MDQGAFGIRWFWHAVLGMIAVTTAALVVLTFVDRAALAAGAAVEAAKYQAPAPLLGSETQASKSAAFIGDSYTAGTGASGPSTRFTSLVASTENWQAQDLAYGGTGYITTATNGVGACGQAHCPDYRAVIAQAKKANPSVVIVTGGRNDVGQRDSDLSSGIRGFYEDLAKALPKAKIYAVSPIWGPDTIPSQLSTIRQDVKDAAGANGATYLDIGEPLQGHADAVIADQVHPNDLGHKLIAAAIEKALKKAA